MCEVVNVFHFPSYHLRGREREGGGRKKEREGEREREREGGKRDRERGEEERALDVSFGRKKTARVQSTDYDC